MEFNVTRDAARTPNLKYIQLPFIPPSESTRARQDDADTSEKETRRGNGTNGGDSSKGWRAADRETDEEEGRKLETD